eukprot:164547_1
MAMIVFFALIFALINGSEWKYEPESLTRADSSQAIGYYNSTIFVIGGSYYSRSLITYDPSTQNIQYSPGIITAGIRCYGQGWAQMDNLLYTIPWSGTHLAIYNMGDNTFTVQEQIHQELDRCGCMVTHDIFIFVLGGESYSNGYFNTTQIFNTSSHQWMNQTPTLSEAKEGMACIYHPN